jgi:YidC/Oxa1 family membrane protein insertase
MLKVFFISLINLIKFINLDIKKKEYVFFSESKFYKDHFIDLITNLKKRNQNNIILITSDKDDMIFFKDILTCYYIENYFILRIFFKILNCKFLIMTLTDLGYHLEKSKFCSYYVYFFHAIASTHKIYSQTAFKNYDIILTNGEYQTNELILAEKKFNFPKKEIINSGYFFLDNIKRKAKLDSKINRNVLFAPSWNYEEKNLFNDYSIDIISKLLSDNFKVTLRPHPEHYKRSKQIIHKIKKLYFDNKNFILDKDTSNLNSLEKAEILLTDNSSIVFEFVLIFERPIIYLNYKDKIHNKNIDKLTIKTIEDEFKDNFGNVLNISNLKYLPNLCEDLLIKNNLTSEKIKFFSKKHLSNLGNSSSFASKYLINKSNKK